MLDWLKPPPRADWPLTAIQPDWPSPEQADRILENAPKSGATHNLRLPQDYPLSAKTLWAEYVPPLVHYNGIESAEDIRSIVFCRGRFLTATAVSTEDAKGKTHTLVDFKITETLGLLAIADQIEPGLPKEDCYSGLFDSHYQTHAQSFDEFIVLDYSAQGNWGGELIFQQTEEELSCIYFSQFVTSESNSKAGRMQVPNWFEKRLREELSNRIVRDQLCFGSALSNHPLNNLKQ